MDSVLDGLYRDEWWICLGDFSVIEWEGWGGEPKPLLLLTTFFMRNICMIWEHSSNLGGLECNIDKIWFTI